MMSRSSAGSRCAHAGLAILALIIGVGGLAACSPQAEQSAPAAGVPDESADLDAIRAVLEDVKQADMSGDIDGLLSYYTEDVVSMPPDLPALVGKDALRAYYEDAFSQISIEKLEMTPEEIHVAGDWAFSRGKFEETVVPSAGDPFDVVGKFLFILHREADGSWKVARLIGNMDAPR
jgi:uncharacterized protein (TIGR02246 family)